MRLWSLIDIQHDLKAILQDFYAGMPSKTHRSCDQIDAFDAILREYVAQTWRIVPIQIQLRLKLIEVNQNNVNDADENEIVDVEIKDEPVDPNEAACVASPSERSDFCGDENQQTQRTSERRSRKTSWTLATFGLKHPNGTFDCIHCDQKSMTFFSLTHHINRWHPDVQKQYECSECDKSYYSKSGLKAHMRKHQPSSNVPHRVIDNKPRPDHHQENRPSYLCRICDQKFSTRRTLYEHLRCMHQAEPFGCDCCFSSFSTNEQLARHKSMVHGAARPYECYVCHHGFFDLATLRAHIFNHYIEPVQCMVCRKLLKTADYLKTHLETQHGIGSREKVDERHFLCSECGKSFPTKTRLMDHAVIHTGDRPFACIVCGATFKMKKHLQEHAKGHSNAFGTYACGQCGKVLKSKGSLRSHERTVHVAEKLHSCTQCDMRFASTSLLTAHLRTHTGEKPFVCKHCDMKFRTFKSRQVHVRKEHTGEQPFACDQCPKRFFVKQHLIKHKIEHTGVKPFSCDECGKGFVTMYDVTAHKKRYHSDTGPQFQCDVCAKTFRQQSNLTRHKQTHTGERPYSCVVCHKAFADAHTVRAHMRLHDKAKSLGVGVTAANSIAK